MAVRFDLYLEPHPWLSAAREILLSAMSSMEAVNRRVAAEALSQLCVVVDIEFVREVINAIPTLNKEFLILESVISCT